MKNYKNFFFELDGVLASPPMLPNMENSSQIFSNDGFFDNLKPVPQVIQIMDRLIENGNSVYILSATTSNSMCWERKKSWISENLPNIPEENIFFVARSSEKSTMFSWLSKFLGISKYETVLVDDSRQTIESVRGAYGNAIHISELLTDYYDY